MKPEDIHMDARRMPADADAKTNDAAKAFLEAVRPVMQALMTDEPEHVERAIISCAMQAIIAVACASEQIDDEDILTGVGFAIGSIFGQSPNPLAASVLFSVAVQEGIASVRREQDSLPTGHA